MLGSKIRTKQRMQTWQCTVVGSGQTRQMDRCVNW